MTWHLELFLICVYEGKGVGVVVNYREKVEEMFDILVWLFFFFYELFLIVESMNTVPII